MMRKHWSMAALSILPAIGLAGLAFVFHMVSLGRGVQLPVPGHSLLTGFTVDLSDAPVYISPQPFMIIAAMGLVASLLAAVCGMISKRKISMYIYSAGGLLAALGMIAQTVDQLSRYSCNPALPKAVRELFATVAMPGLPLFMAGAALTGLAGIIAFFLLTPAGGRLSAAISAQPLKAIQLIGASMALVSILLPFKLFALNNSNTLCVYGTGLLFGHTSAFKDASVAFAPYPALIAAFLLIAALLLSAALSKRALPRVMMSTGGFFLLIYNIFAESGAYGRNMDLPLELRKAYDGNFTMFYYLIIGITVVLILISAIEQVTVVNPKLGVKIMKHAPLYVFMLPGVILLVLFFYLPMLGVVMAFQQYDPVSGFLRSQWVGLSNFRFIFGMPNFIQAIANTVYISVLKLVISFPLPIVFALLLNELTSTKFKRVVQSISYLPNFISWVIVSGIFYQILSPDTGIVNEVLKNLRIIDEPIYFMQSKSLFYPIIVFTDVWKNLGFQSILYMAAIASIDPELYEAAAIDRAGRFRMAWHITLPGMKSTIVLLFIMAIASLLNAGFDQLWTMGNTAVQSVGEILDTLQVRYLTRGSLDQLSLGAAMGLFKAVIGLALFVGANMVSRALNQDSLI